MITILLDIIFVLTCIFGFACGVLPAFLNLTMRFNSLIATCIFLIVCFVDILEILKLIVLLIDKKNKIVEHRWDIQEGEYTKKELKKQINQEDFPTKLKVIVLSMFVMLSYYMTEDIDHWIVLVLSACASLLVGLVILLINGLFTKSKRNNEPF